MIKTDQNTISALQKEILVKDDIIEKATKIIKALQKELEIYQNKEEEEKRKSFHLISKNEISAESLNKKLQVPRGLRMNLKENLKTTKILEDCLEKERNGLEKKCSYLEKNLYIELENKEKCQALLTETMMKLEICENIIKNVIIFFFQKTIVFSQKEIETKKLIEEKKMSFESFSKNIQDLNKKLSFLMEKDQIPIRNLEIKTLKEIKKIELRNEELEYFSLLSVLNLEIKKILEINGPKITEYLEKIQNLGDSCFHDKKLISLEKENIILKKKIEEATKTSEILTAVNYFFLFKNINYLKMLYDHQKAIRCFRSVIDEMSNSFSLLNIKNNDIVSLYKSGFDIARIQKITNNKKFSQVFFILKICFILNFFLIGFIEKIAGNI